MGLLIALAIGGIFGWLAAILSRRDRRHGVLPWSLAGMFGALLGAFVLGPVFGGGNILESVLDIRTLYVSAVGAAAFLGSVIWFRRRRRPAATVDELDPI